MLQLLALYPLSRIVATAPSQSAADTIAQRLLKSGAQASKIFRFNDKLRGKNTLPSSLLPVSIVSEDGKFSVPSLETYCKYNIVVCTFVEAGILSSIGLSNQGISKAREAYVNNVNGGFADLGMSQITMPNLHHYTHLFMDEAAQATEPETLIPICTTIHSQFPVQIILCGDPYQLGPILQSRRARQNGLSESLIGRLLERKAYTDANTYNVVRLRRNYRSHPALVMMPSVLFYSDRLIAAADASKTSCKIEISQLNVGKSASGSPVNFNLKFPFLFHNTDSEDSYDLRENVGVASWRNVEEGEVIVKYVQQLVRLGVDQLSIGIMATFRGQVQLLRQKLRMAGMSIVNVGAVEDYQGMERAVILLSTVRTSVDQIPKDMQRGVGVIHQRNRLNVALTRGMQMMVVVGSAKTLAVDPYWRQIFRFCDRNELWRGTRD
jgi:superfamily I DNA and/or RNA helicase